MRIPMSVLQLFLAVLLHSTKLQNNGYYLCCIKGIFALGLISAANGVLAFGEPAQEIVAPASVSYNGHSNGGAISAGGSSSGSSSGGGGSTNINYNRPYFDDISPHNVTAIVDETAILKCRVKNKGDRTVSWMRKRDLHILTSNIYTYTGDQRFSVVHPPDTEDFDLKIEYVQPRDIGTYICQVNTEPKINLAVLLHVTEDRDLAGHMYGGHERVGGGKAVRAKIIGSQEIHVKRGSTISLSCSVNMHASSITWYHGSSIVDFDSVRGGISLETEKTETGTTSRLLLTRATLRDSGNYSCVPAAAISASIQVHVLNGEHPAAMQTSSCGPCPSQTALIFLSILSMYIADKDTISLFAKYFFLNRLYNFSFASQTGR